MAKKLVILLATHASRGGILNYFRLLQRQLETDGCEVQCVALFRGDNESPPGGFNILLDRTELGAAEYLYALLLFWRFCLRHRPSVILGAMPLANIAAGLARTLVRSAVIATHHSPRETQHPILRAADALLGALHAYSEIICVSASVAESFARYPRRYVARIRTIRNGVPPISPSATSHEVRRGLRLADDQSFLLMTGRLAPQKNVCAAVRAIALSRNLKLFLTGDGSERGEIERLIRELCLGDRVHLLGSVDYQRLINLVFSCDVFVQVSLFEGHSMSLLEAIVAQRPIVVSNVPSQIEAVTLPDGRLAAVACEPTDVSGIAAAMHTAAFDENRRSALFEAVNDLSRSLPTEAEMLASYSTMVKQFPARRSDR